MAAQSYHDTLVNNKGRNEGVRAASFFVAFCSREEIPSNPKMVLQPEESLEIMQHPRADDSGTHDLIG